VDDNVAVAGQGLMNCVRVVHRRRVVDRDAIAIGRKRPRDDPVTSTARPW
jgi:hypothetical protein